MFQFKDIQEVYKAIKNPINTEKLAYSREIYEKGELHIAGLDIEEFIENIPGFTTDDHLATLKKIAKPMTKPLYAKYLLPVDNVFTASNSKRTYTNGTDNQVKELSDLCKEEITKFLHKENKKVFIDPAGLFIAELVNGKLKINYYDCEDYFDINYNSIVDINYIIFNKQAHEKYNIPVENYLIELYEKEEVYRVLDSKQDALYVIRNQEISLVYSVENIFGILTGAILSTKKNPANDAITSHIEESFIEADEYLFDYVNYKLNRLQVSIQNIWEYERGCSNCNATGIVGTNGGQCPVCHGTKINNKRNTSEKLIVPMPQFGDNNNIVPPMGIVNSDINILTEAKENLERREKAIKTAIWGETTDLKTQKGDVTAYQIAVQSEQEKQRKSEIAENFEILETFFTDIYGWFYFRDTYKSCYISYGRNFNTFNAGELYKNYELAKKENFDTTILDELLLRYYQSEYKNDIDTLNKMVIELKTKPLFHYTITDLSTMQIPEFDFYANIFYSDFAKYYEETYTSLSVATYEDVKKELEVFVNEKLKLDRMNEVKEINSPVDTNIN